MMAAIGRRHAVEKASGRQRRSRRNWRYGPAEFEPIETLIRQGFSPEQIVGRRKLEGQAGDEPRDHLPLDLDG